MVTDDRSAPDSDGPAPMTPLASTLPQNTGSGYVAAAYIVFFAIVLIYVAIMALRLTSVERSLRELRARAEQPGDRPPHPGTPEHPGRPPRAETARQDETDETDGRDALPDQPRERETV